MTYILAANAGGHGANILVTLFIILVVAKILAEIFERLKQPAVVGEILAGILIGPSVLNWVSPSELTTVLAEIGVIFLLFTVGLETKPAAIFKVGKSAFLVAVLGVIAPFIGGWLLMKAWGSGGIEALFVGTAMVATSVGITARVLGSMGLLDAPTSRIILGAAVIDDILGLLVLAAVSSLAAGSINYIEIGFTALLSIGFTLLMVFIGAPILKRLAPTIDRLRLNDSVFIFGLLFCLGLSAAASFIGIAAIIGAFLAGMALSEATEDNHTLHKQTQGITEFLVPFFLVNIGMQLKLEVFKDTSVIVLSLLVTFIAIITKLLGCGLATWSLGLRRASQVGMGMVPRGEVGIVVAQIGLSMAVVGDSLYGVVLFMAIATTLIAPPFLKILYSTEEAAHKEIGPANAGGILTDEKFSRLG
jgi:Kef-type K+ transport system membrane component KefB